MSPVGKQYRDIGQLSGGEKTVATLALLFALHSFQRAPFFIMDEVDDALDNANVERVTRYLLENSKTTQCIIISHKDLLFEKSDSLVGVYHSWQESSSATLTLDLRKYDTPSESQSSVCLSGVSTLHYRVRRIYFAVSFPSHPLCNVISITSILQCHFHHVYSAMPFLTISRM